LKGRLWINERIWFIDPTAIGLEEIIQIIKHEISLLASPTPNILIMGDFNFPFMKWPNGTISGCTTDEKKQALSLTDLMNECFLLQYIMKPTRKSNILDLVFSNNHEFLHSHEVYKTLFSDHNLIEVNTNKSRKTIKPIQAPKEVKNEMEDFNFFNDNIDWNDI
jgi:hypothetical protein